MFVKTPCKWVVIMGVGTMPPTDETLTMIAAAHEPSPARGQVAERIHGRSG
jgi:hypothetical protein